MKKAKPFAYMAAYCAILTVTIGAGLSADGPQSAFELPANPQVVAYLLESVNWYRHVYTERQVANDPADLLFLEDNQAIERQIVRLSFEFAKADAALATAVPSQHNGPTTPGSAGPPTSDLAHFIELKNRSDQHKGRKLFMTSIRSNAMSELLARPALLRKSLKCQEWVVSIPTAPTSLLVFCKGLAKSTRQQKAAITANSVGR